MKIKEVQKTKPLSKKDIMGRLNFRVLNFYIMAIVSFKHQNTNIQMIKFMKYNICNCQSWIVPKMLKWCREKCAICLFNANYKKN